MVFTLEDEGFRQSAAFGARAVATLFANVWKFHFLSHRFFRRNFRYPSNFSAMIAPTRVQCLCQEYWTDRQNCLAHNVMLPCSNFQPTGILVTLEFTLRFDQHERDLLNVEFIPPATSEKS